MELSIILLLIVLPLLCIAALMIMFAKRLHKDDGVIKGVIKNILTIILVLNYIYYIMIGIEYLTNIISESYFYNDPMLPFIFLYFLILIVSVIILLCNLIRVIVKKTNGSWKRILLYILICLISILIEFMIIPMYYDA